MDDRQRDRAAQGPPPREEPPAAEGGLLRRHRAERSGAADDRGPDDRRQLGRSVGRDDGRAWRREPDRERGDEEDGRSRRASALARSADARGDASRRAGTAGYDPAEADAILDAAEDEGPPRRGDQADRGRRARAATRRRDEPASWDDGWQDDWDDDWETGTWDTAWANDEPDVWDDEDLGDVDQYDDQAWARSLVALGAASMAEAPMGRVARIRLVLRERPAAGAMLIVFLLGFALSCAAPIVPLLRLSYDGLDALRQASALNQMVHSGAQELLQPSKLQEVQGDVDSLQRDLYEINAATNVLGAPLAAVSPAARDYRLLVRIGYDLSVAAQEGVQVGQTLLIPLQGGALSTSSSAPGITPADFDQARGLLADARARVADAVAAYHALDMRALPAQLRPGSQYGALLALLPTSTGIFDELETLINIAPALLGVGQPAYYLVIAMDRAELRPGGGFQGNYGILTLEGGKQPADQPLSLEDTYTLDQKYYTASLPTSDAQDFAQAECAAQESQGAPAVTPDYYGPEPPRYYWWWPFRDFSWCFNWGLRDSNLSPDFPTNARVAMNIVEATPGEVPNNAPLQGVIAFTPALIEDMLRIPGVGPVTLSQFPKDPPITAENLEEQIHCHQLPNPNDPSCTPPGSDAQSRKFFTHLLSEALLARIKTLHGGALQQLVKVALAALKSKDLEVYFSDPRVELIVQQLGLGAQIHTGGGDGFFVVDTNDGGNKANLYVSEQEQDLVTLLPGGGAVHRLQITVNYDYPKLGWAYAVGGDTLEDYNAVQRVYMPADADIIGASGYVGLTQYAIHPSNEPQVPADYGDPEHLFDGTVTLSDVPGRTMVMGHVAVACTVDDQGQPLYGVYPYAQQSCNHDPHPGKETIEVQWYTPDAWTAQSGGHGSYAELVEKQAGTDAASGSTVDVSVYVDTSQVTGAARSVDWTSASARASALKKATRAFDGPLTGDSTVSFSF